MKHRKLAKYWIELQKLSPESKDAEELTWVLIDIGDLLFHNSKECFNFVLEVLRQTDDDWVLTNLGAGPLEDLLGQHPEEVLAMVEDELPHNPKLKQTLQHVWQNLMPDDTWERVQKLRK